MIIHPDPAAIRIVIRSKRQEQQRLDLRWPAGKAQHETLSKQLAELEQLHLLLAGDDDYHTPECWR